MSKTALVIFRQYIRRLKSLYTNRKQRTEAERLAKAAERERLAKEYREREAAEREKKRLQQETGRPYQADFYRTKSIYCMVGLAADKTGCARCLSVLYHRRQRIGAAQQAVS